MPCIASPGHSHWHSAEKQSPAVPLLTFIICPLHWLKAARIHEALAWICCGQMGLLGPSPFHVVPSLADLCASAQLCWPAWSFCYLYASPTVCYKTQIFTHAKFTVGPHREAQAPLPHFPRWYFPWDKGMKGWCLQQWGEMPEVLITLQLKMEISVMIPKQAAKIWKSGNSVNLEFDIRTGWFQLDVHAFISLVIPFFFFPAFHIIFFSNINCFEGQSLTRQNR